jgi:transcriptional regulator with XRE-family HTH domain
MAEIQTWRSLLGSIIIDVQERQRIANELGVHPLTLTRWASGISSPRVHHLRTLSDSLPQYRQELRELIAREYPLAVEEDEVFLQEKEEIPINFYSQVLRLYASSPTILRASTLRSLILQQALKQFSKINIGVEVILATLIPSDAQKVRSLRSVEGRGSPPFSSTYDSKPILIGIESLAGSAVTYGRTFAVQDKEEMRLQFPDDVIKGPHTASMASCPILLADHVSGCIIISSSSENFFLPSRIDLLKCYADLLTLTFTDEDFYGLASIELIALPGKSVQNTFLGNFQQRITRIIAESNDRGVVVSRLEAERIAWKQVEDEVRMYGLDTAREGHRLNKAAPNLK